MSDASLAPRWRVLVTPRWIGWHLFSVAAVIGMFWLGDWQLRRALAGNGLSWAYTFEWPIFAIFGVVFWFKTIRDELHPPDSDVEAPGIDLPAGAAGADGGQVLASTAAKAGLAGTSAAGQDVGGPGGADGDDAELSEYNAYLAKLASQVKGHGRWHGLR